MEDILPEFLDVVNAIPKKLQGDSIVEAAKSNFMGFMRQWSKDAMSSVSLVKDEIRKFQTVVELRFDQLDREAADHVAKLYGKRPVIDAITERYRATIPKGRISLSFNELEKRSLAYHAELADHVTDLDEALKETQIVAQKVLGLPLGVDKQRWLDGNFNNRPIVLGKPRFIGHLRNSVRNGKSEQVLDFTPIMDPASGRLILSGISSGRRSVKRLKLILIGTAVLAIVAVVGFLVLHGYSDDDAAIPGEIIVCFKKEIPLATAEGILKGRSLAYTHTNDVNIGRIVWEQSGEKFIVKVPPRKEASWREEFNRIPEVYGTATSYDENKLHID